MSESTEKAILAGGCFWGIQDLFDSFPGVVSTRVGYTGGEVPNATYRNHRGHAEAIEITFDSGKQAIATFLNFSSRFTIRRRLIVRETITAQAIAQRSSTPAKSRRRSRTKRSPIQMHQGSGQDKS
jgi:hypothetical protein